MKKHIFLFYLGFIFIFIACNSLAEKKNLKRTQEYYETFSERKDINKIMTFYSNSPKYIDAVPQMMIEGKEDLSNQFNWSDTSYEKHPNYPKSVEIDEILANDSVVVVNGKYNPYYYNKKLIDEMKFTTWLYFDKEGKIKKLIEWTQYPIDILEEIIMFKKNAQIN